MITKTEIIDYIMSTPENTNRAVLEPMLDDLSRDKQYTMDVYIAPQDSPLEGAEKIGEIVATPGIKSVILYDRPKNYNLEKFCVCNSSFDNIITIPFTKGGKNNYHFITVNPTVLQVDRYAFLYTINE